MAAMFASRAALRGLAAGLLAGCGGGPAGPEPMAAELPPARPLTAAESLRVERMQAELTNLVAAEKVDAADELAREILAIDPRHAQATATVGWCWMRIARRESPPDLGLWRRAEG